MTKESEEKPPYIVAVVVIGLVAIWALGFCSMPIFTSQTPNRSPGNLAPIDPGIYEPYTESDFPVVFERYNGWGEVRSINKARKWAAEKAARRRDCDRVTVSEVSDKRSIPGRTIVIFVDCANGLRIFADQWGDPISVTSTR